MNESEFVANKWREYLMSDQPENIETTDAGAMVPVPSGGFSLEKRSPRFWTNINQDKPENKWLVMHCHQKADLSSEQVVGTTFKLVHILAHPVRVQAQADGELLQLVRCVLVNDEGQTCSFVSQGIYDALELLISTYGPGPFDPSMPCTIRPLKTRAGRQTYEINVPKTYTPKSLKKDK